MKLPALMASWLTIGGLRRTTLACLGLTVVLLLASVVLVVAPAAGALISGNPAGSISPILQLLPVAASVLGLVTAALCLGVGTGMTPADGGTAESMSAVTAELRTLLARERQELSTFQAACETKAREAGTRLASLLADAETQLRSGSGQGPQPAELARASEMVARLERMVPMIARLVEPEASAAVITSAAETMERAIIVAVSGAAGQITALGDAAAALRRDASTLDRAAREIALAGANVVTRVGEAAGHVEAAAATLPSAGETLRAATQRAVETLGQASAALASDGATLGAMAREVGRSADALRAGATTLHESGDSFTQRLAGAGRDIEARLASLPALSQVLGSQAGQLLRSAENLLETARTAAQSSESAASAAARADGIVAGLAGYAAEISGAAAVLKEGADGLRHTSLSVAQDGGAAATRIAAAAREVLAALPNANEMMKASSAALREGADAVSREVAGLTVTGQDVARRIAAELEQVQAVAHGLAHASIDLRTQASQVAGAAAQFVEVGQEAGTALRAETERTASSIVSATSALEGVIEAAAGAVTDRVAESGAILDAHRTEAAQVLAGLLEQAAVLTDVGQALERGTDAAIEQICQAVQTAIDGMDAASVRAADSVARTGETLQALDTAAAATAASGQHIVAQLARFASDVCTQGEAQAAALPAIAEQIATLLDLVRKTRETVPDPELLAELARAGTRLPATGELLEGIVRDIRATLSAREAMHPEVLASLESALTKLSGDAAEMVRRLEAACTASEAAGASMASSVTQVQSAAASVAQAIATVTAQEDASSHAPLRHLRGLEREAAALMRDGEALAEAAAAGRTEDVPAWLADGTAEILSAVDTTIHRLRSVATAVAFASDAVVQRAGTA
jgi:ABC-type transporter Mla subunit MlaD